LLTQQKEESGMTSLYLSIVRYGYYEYSFVVAKKFS